MIKITNEIDGKKYELVNGYGSCAGCAFNSQFGCCVDMKQRVFNHRLVCKELYGKWKEVRDGK
jgi:hypothetical protein